RYSHGGVAAAVTNDDVGNAVTVKIAGGDAVGVGVPVIADRDVVIEPGEEGTIAIALQIGEAELIVWDQDVGESIAIEIGNDRRHAGIAAGCVTDGRYVNRAIAVAQ